MKILITGNAGSGKSTLARTLANKYSLAYSSLDSIVWQEGWKKTARDVRKKEIAKLINQNSWVIDGVDYDVMQAADTIIFLDYPRRICLFRALKRNIPYLFKSRPELPKNCPEILALPKIIKIIWKFPSSVRPRMLVARNQKGLNFTHIQSDAELRAYLNSL